MARIGRGALVTVLALLSAPSMVDAQAQSLESEINAAMGVASAPAPEPAATAAEPAPQPGPQPVGETPEAPIADPLSPWTEPAFTPLPLSASAGVYCVPTTQICVDNIDELVEVIIAYLTPRPCDPGDIGVQPACFALESEPCPPGYVGLPPLCVDPSDLFPAACPPDTTGVPPACTTTDGLLPAVGSVADDDCPEGNAASLSPMCAAREGSLSAAFAVASGGYDNLFPTTNSRWYCVKGGVCQTDNRTLTAYLSTTLTPDGKTHIRWTLDNTWDTTDLNVSYHSTAVLEGNSETDIFYKTEPGMVSPNKDGTTYCDDPGGSFRCDQHYVYFRYATPSESLACHETGHAVGLLHGADAGPAQSNRTASLGCMRDPVYSDEKYAGGHNTQQINDTY